MRNPSKNFNRGFQKLISRVDYIHTVESPGGQWPSPLVSRMSHAAQIIMHQFTSDLCTVAVLCGSVGMQHVDVASLLQCNVQFHSFSHTHTHNHTATVLTLNNSLSSGYWVQKFNNNKINNVFVQLGLYIKMTTVCETRRWGTLTRRPVAGPDSRRSGDRLCGQ